MTNQKQPASRFRDELGIVSPWVKVFAGAAFVACFVGLTMIMWRDHNPPPRPLAPLLGLVAGTMVACYILLIGYINQDAGQRGMSRLLWTLVAIFVPNALGIVLFFILRKPRTSFCPRCNSEVAAGFSYCPRCRHRLQPVCPQCQKSVGPGDKFCPYCGGTLEVVSLAAGVVPNQGTGPV